MALRACSFNKINSQRLTAIILMSIFLNFVKIGVFLYIEDVKKAIFPTFYFSFYFRKDKIQCKYQKKKKDL